MSEKPDGGAAFPFTYVHPDTKGVKGETGMSLRDYFAGQALAELLRISAGIPDFAAVSRERLAEGVAKSSYMLADTMLTERQK